MQRRGAIRLRRLSGTQDAGAAATAPGTSAAAPMISAPHERRIAAWIVPADYPTGTFNYKVTATDTKGNSVTWEPFKVASSQLRIEAGAIEIKK